MGKLPSIETQLKHAKAKLVRETRLSNMRLDNVFSLRIEAARNLARAIAAEKELTEWKERFDVLLRRTEKG